MSTRKLYKSTECKISTPDGLKGLLEQTKLVAENILGLLHISVSFYKRYNTQYIYVYISHQELVSCNQNVFINPQELILTPTAASEKSEVVAGKRTPGLLI